LLAFHFLGEMFVLSSEGFLVFSVCPHFRIISVSQTVEHSSTIISDILSRILNETVMREETICRICFNLLNDIDYHLKEAQEKTDELTGKFLDKGKDPLSYRPQPIVTAASATVSSHSSQVEEAATTSDRQRHAKGRRSKTASISSATSQSKNRQIKVNSNFSSSGSSRKRKQTESESAASHHQDYDTDGAPLTEDEMSVNVINRNKQKLLSHVLNPRMIKKETRVYEYEEEEEEEEETEKEEEEEEEEEEDEEEEAEEEEEYYEPKWKKKKGKENRRERRKRKKLQQQVRKCLFSFTELFYKRVIFFSRRTRRRSFLYHPVMPSHLVARDQLLLQPAPPHHHPENL
jgi:hypothetical protein